MTECTQVRETSPGCFAVSNIIENWDVIRAEAEKVTRLDRFDHGKYNSLYLVVDSGEWEHVYLVREETLAS